MEGRSSGSGCKALRLHFPAFSSVLMAAVTHRALLAANDGQGSADSGSDQPGLPPALPFPGQSWLGVPGGQVSSADKENITSSVLPPVPDPHSSPDAEDLHQSQREKEKGSEFEGGCSHWSLQEPHAPVLELVLVTHPTAAPPDSVRGGGW